MPDVLEVVQVVASVVEVPVTPAQVIEIPAVVGPRGPAGSGALVVPQPEQGTWTIPHDLGRLPAVFLVVDGHSVSAPDVITDTHVIVTWPFPVAGIAILI